MFGLGVGHFVVLLIFALIPIYIIKRTKEEYKAGVNGRPGKNDRHCLVCGFDGPMKTWLGNYSLPQLIALIGLLFYAIPGLIFIVWAYGKYKCPKCGALAKNHQLSNSPQQTKSIPPTPVVAEKSCPFCAEIIKAEAILCRYCQHDLPQNS